jgi:signal transduction histidine kinase/HAMP domain-containing protein
MRRFWKGLNAQLQYQIIAPFLLLTVVVMVAGALVVFSMLGQSLEERFANQLASVTRSANDALISQEQANLQFLREVTFALPNEQTGAPAVASALAEGDSAGLAAAMEPFFEVAATRNEVLVDRLIAFDSAGQTVVDFEYPEDGSGDYIVHKPLDLSSAWFTSRVLSGAADDQGDKYAGLIKFADTGKLYFATIAPARLGDDVAGGVIVAMSVDNLLARMAARSQAAGVTLYDQAGRVVSSTFDGVQPMELRLLSDYEASENPAEETIFSKETIGGRDYQFAYVPLEIRGANVGIIAPALSRSYVMETTNSTVWPIVALIGVLSLVIIGGGIAIARFITRPLEELARTARAISKGETMRRANVAAENEIGQLASSFNQMTEYLVRLYGQVQAEASQRAAIVESITDGIVVVDDLGNVKMVNRATRRLMGIGDAAPLPTKLSDIPLNKLVEGVPGFGAQRAHDLYTLGDYIVKASIAPVIGSGGARSGYVCLLQDMTAEVTVDRAKTNFIGVISHELKTPLTVIRGNADLLLRGLAGPIDGEQRVFVDSIRHHANNMTSLVQNVIVIARLDSGFLIPELEPMELARPVGEAAFPLQGMIKAKGLTLSVDIAEDLRPVLADYDQVRQIMHHLLDNARLYTSSGGITVRALDGGDHVRVEVQDTGRGISPDMQEQIFQRFIRGDGTSEGINSAERGIGLGLAICKQFVEGQGGTIGVSSVPGQGSTFYFTLRYADDTPSPEKKTPMAAAA